jgi:hypothetical protein
MEGQPFEQDPNTPEPPHEPLREDIVDQNNVLLVVIVIILALGILFIAWKTLAPETPAVEPQDEDEVLEELEQTRDSDELDAIEADLEATNFDDIDEGSDDVDRALEAY